MAKQKQYNSMEFLDIVDENDVIIGKAEKDEIYRKQLRHRIVHVLVINNQGEIALQLRSNNVSFCPLYWCTSASGHVQSGEDYEQAALREYQEELGTTSELEWLGKELYQCDISPDKFLGIFTTKFTGQFKPDANVVKEITFCSIGRIKEMISNKEKIHPELLFILNKYYL